MRNTMAWAAALLAATLLASCGDKDAATTAEAPKPASRTLAASLDGDLARVVDNAGLKTALEGVGPYTLFAPPQTALKPAGADFTDPDLKAEGAALLRPISCRAPSPAPTSPQPSTGQGRRARRCAPWPATC
jgi:hypothetical protein